MSRRSLLGDAGLLRRHYSAGWRASLLVALLVGVTVAGVALAPRALARLGDRELRHALMTTSATELDLAGIGQLGYADTAAQQNVATDVAIRNVRLGLPEPLRDLVGQPHWLARTSASTVTLPREQQLTLDLRLAIDLAWDQVARPVEGRLPDAYDGRGPIEVAVSRALAERVHLRVGDRLPNDPAPLLVTAIVEIDDPDGSYAVHSGDLVAPTVQEAPDTLPTVLGTALVHPDSASALREPMAGGSIVAWFPIDASRVRYADADTLQPQARRLASTPVELPNGGRLSLRTGLADVVERTSDRIASTYALLALALSGLAGVLVAVFALGVQTVLDRRRPALALASARGAGRMQVRAVMVLEGLLIAVPVSALAILVVSTLVPATLGPVGRALPVLTALLVPLLFGVLTNPRTLHQPRRDLRVATHGRGRPVLEIAVVALAALSLLSLVRRGVVESSRAVGIDPLVVAAPALLTAAVCVLVLRVFPWPLLLLQRRLRSRRGPVAVLGAARAVRSPALGFAAALALVVGLSVVTFSAVMATTIRSGLEHSVREGVGADVRLSAARFDDGDLAAVRRLAGVDAAALLTVRSGVELDLGRTARVEVVVTDTAALHDVRPDLPVLAGRGQDALPLLLGTDRAEEPEDVLLDQVPAVVTSVVGRDLLPGLDRRWVLVDQSALPTGAAEGDGEPRELLLVRVQDGAAADEVAGLAAAAVGGHPDVEVVDVDEELAAVSSSPVVGGLRPALLVSALVALVLTMLTVVLASLAAARSRHQMLGVLRILGMSRRQLRGVVAWELGPIAVTAVLVGTVFGLLLPRVITRALDLRPFVGGRTPPQPVVEPLLVLAGVAAFVGVVVVAGLVAVAVGRRLAPAETVKMGER
ncbi:FtsX-like permease family protein [Nocardioides sp. MAH-18]|uniref:FtsX-like permease family protein n=1 Tax=Nocardioides agri TaxID=2682843 RepID=A0A6L6XQC4_9ACTN|nr:MULTISPECIES: FtsX-like permease family protein [unclassified Nocardioides]MBA2954632.1 FtsX-like permease family protein [Nocardioides sp. CGMCC 1.13656]MVQ49489.1 FtsX-like permease family protein [Nocardioides sp. MAH-18]